MSVGLSEQVELNDAEGLGDRKIERMTSRKTEREKWEGEIGDERSWKIAARP